MKKIISLLLSLSLIFSLTACSQTERPGTSSEQLSADNSLETSDLQVPENFVLIKGGSFEMGSPESEAWRSADETQHKVTVSDFYMSKYELTQKEYEEITGSNPSNFSGEDLPVENVSWLDAAAYCNARSEKDGLTPVYTIDGKNVSWDKSANGYRLPTEAEWEYACRAGTTTPFYMENSPSSEDANYYGHYPYEIEDNYFSQGNLEVKPGDYRQTTVPVDSFSENPYGLYNMHGNVSEWVWDYYGDYSDEAQTNPTGPATGTLRVYRGGGWNDFAKNMRSAYRATLEQNKGSFNLGIRLVLNAAPSSGSVSGTEAQNTTADGNGKILIAYFSWGGNTEGIAKEIQSQTGADLFEITMVNPYSSDYNTVLDEAQRDQNAQARPELANHIDNMDEYDIIMIGYPNWWASIPMPVASFLEEYDFSGKTILPFCSHGGGRFGQSLTAIAKLAPNAAMGEALSIHYSGGSELSGDVSDWLNSNNIQTN
ncbi:Serine/threonine-protein kinase pkn1 [uncultured Roseburia sp.]|uniref:SUMF1/EgtB/PvdO family nonheme iron enzyme n=1 Tax=Brotonthovivens ammoniilytica TaxID=2981725 RepID=A0ABT2TH73_9FIRM|nr:flavodoxin [Brotonthovivens ammoniilytica]MCU6761545.1 SUMF1/EgtB/PvdO family nonheme iron enzyme [Brotonthovivens ammoniilytica]SCI31488.1 Serine/threonine-protein kinase pkn1 [uncultured Roseburia sp.]